ncbi:RluA family pseudouridine synthase [Myxococcota bacterium]|nr:RluA family pseudouridine synthase [Myxococcota bacterium]
MDGELDRYAPPTDPWLVVVHLDRDLLVLDKPAGLLSVPGRDPAWQDSALTRAARDLGPMYAAHRLDLDTSGLLVLARRRKAEAALKAQFAARSVRKTYLAVVRGQPEDQGRIDLPLARLGGTPPRNVVDPVAGLPAQTRWQVLRRGSEDTLLALFPETGRSHQLRVHLAAVGFPIVGDRLYGGAPAARLMLHAWRLVLRHPWSGEELSLQAGDQDPLTQ